MKKESDNKIILRNSSNIAVQANDFIEARYKDALSFWESFLITKMCTMIAPEDSDFKPYRIYIREIVEYMSLPPSGTVYNYIMEAANRLLERKIVISTVNDEGKKEILDTHLVTSVRRLAQPSKDENLYITLTFQPELKPFLLQLKHDFTKLDMEIYKTLKTTSSIRLYQIFKSYIGKKQYKIEFSLDDLKDMLGVGSKYELYAGFKMRVLEEAQKRLSETTDLTFTYTEVKKGKRVTAIIFHLNPPKLAISQRAESANTPEAKEKLVVDLSPTVVSQFGVSLKVFMNLVEQYTTTEIQRAVEITQKAAKTGKIENVAGYFIKALQEKFIEKTEKQQIIIQQETEKEKEIAKKVKAAEAKHAQEMADAQAHKREQYLKEEQIILKLIVTDDELVQEAVEGIRYSIHNSSYNAEKSLSENLQSPSFKGAFYNEIKKRRPNAFK